MNEMTAERLRALADWLDAHPEAKPPRIDAILDVRRDAEGIAKAAVAIGGAWQKRVDDSYFWLSQEVGPGVEYHIFSGRENVCTRRVVGTEKVLKPDPDAPRIEVEEEIVEWDCAPSLLALSSPLQPERTEPETEATPR